MQLDTILGNLPALFNGGGLLLVNINHMNIHMNIFNINENIYMNIHNEYSDELNE